MFSKALFIDFKKEEILPEYLPRFEKIFPVIEFLPKEDKNLSSHLADTDAIFAKIFTKIGPDLIDAGPNLKYIGVISTAFDAVDAVYAREKNIAVANLGGYSTEAVSEFFFAVLFEKARELEQAREQGRKEDYTFDKFLGFELQGKTLGVIGAGRIGTRTATIGLGIGMKVIYFDREEKKELTKLGATRKELEKVLSRSDFISLNLALDKETEGIINKERVNSLKKGCIFISLSPPGLIDQASMMEKARSGDVTFIFDHSDDIDPNLAKKFLETPNCIVYPPIAFRTKEANTARWETFISNIEKFSEGKPQNVVN